MSTETMTINFRELRHKQTSDRIRAGERLILKDGRRIIADIVPRPPGRTDALKDILAPIRTAAKKIKADQTAPGKNLILEDRERLRR